MHTIQRLQGNTQVTTSVVLPPISQPVDSTHRTDNSGSMSLALHLPHVSERYEAFLVSVYNHCCRPVLPLHSFWR